MQIPPMECLGFQSKYPGVFKEHCLEICGTELLSILFVFKSI